MTTYLESGSHSHFFYTTLTNNLSSDFPSYYSARTLDDLLLLWYGSDERVVERRFPWFKGAANSSLLAESLTEFNYQAEMQETLNNIQKYLNVTEGYQVLQNIEGCLLSDNDSVVVIWSYRYNGEPLMSLDWETRKWTADDPAYEDLVEELYGNSTMDEKEKNVTLNNCIPHIRELLSLGRCTLGRREAPVVKVSLILSDDVGVRLSCRAYGHYPKDIFMMWYKNGEEIPEEMMERVTLPLPDITYLTSLTLNISPATADVYTCEVGHISVPENLTLNWRFSDDNEYLSAAPSVPEMGVVIAICLAVILVVSLIVFGFISFAKSRQH
ncbi:zinc-alpha-2-glycoprotein-like isoform X2 [Engystomops pustulosus]|uniref:zinc-alpha-2-glycoprotein-like isoform X2 n=1 Tax=Engystomops pustulosus TaxID=76066 RepID=UPI003AFAA7B3